MWTLLHYYLEATYHRNQRFAVKVDNSSPLPLNRTCVHLNLAPEQKKSRSWWESISSGPKKKVYKNTSPPGFN